MMNRNLRRGLLAQDVALQLWSDLRPVAPGSVEDRAHIDAKNAQGLYVQVKLDVGVRYTRNVFWEMAKRGNGIWNAMGGNHWHGATAAHEYIFVTSFEAFRITMGEMVMAGRGKRLRIRNETGFGVFIPIDEMEHERREHPWSFMRRSWGTVSNPARSGA